MLQTLQIVEGDLVIQNNPIMRSLQGAAQSLKDVYGQVLVVSILYNHSSFGAGQLLNMSLLSKMKISLYLYVTLLCT